jgi:hypothetical protein
MTTRGLLESAKLRAHRRNGGVRADSAGFRHYIKKFQYREMDRGAIFGEELMNAFAGINTGIEMPLVFQGDETVCYSLLLPRKSPFVVDKIGRDEPREKRGGPHTSGPPVSLAVLPAGPSRACSTGPNY